MTIYKCKRAGCDSEHFSAPSTEPKPAYCPFCGNQTITRHPMDPKSGRV